MKIKEIKLYGFKSFRDDTKVLLNTGVTAFVGPNGSGKSNIFDALRWVFGEQSMKALRCDKIEDLVHESADSTEDANFSEVAVTIDNEDYFPQFGSEFEIKRRFYRTGESEFFLNRVKCRLQDIQALFLNSGALTYSFLELAEVERIIHGNTKEMFDDVAGILKYQERKEQTKRRLAATEQDLLRLEDIIAEMNRGLRGLRRQVRQARLYGELRTEYRDVKLYLMAGEFAGLLTEIEAVQAQVDAREGERQSLLHAIRQLEDEREQLKRSIESAETEKKQNVAQINEFVDTIEFLQKEIAEKEEEARSRTIESERALTSIKEKQELVGGNRKRLAEAEQERDRILAGLTDLQSQIEQIRTRTEAKNAEYFALEKALKENSARIADHAGKIAEAQSIAAKLRYDRENKESILARTSEEVSQQQNAMETLRSKRRECEQEAEAFARQQAETEESLRVLREKLTGIQAGLAEAESNLKSREDAIADCRIMIDTLSRRLHVEGAKAIEQRFGGRMAGMFKDSIEVASGYEAVIDVCLGDVLAFYLLREYDAADLAECPEGRFGFIDMAPDAFRSEPRDIPGTRPLTEFVSFKTAGDILTRYLGDFFYVEDFDRARELSRQYPGHGFVTKNAVLFMNGTVIVEKGEIGFFRISQSLEEYKNKMEALRNELLFIEQEKQRLTGEMSQTQQQIESVQNDLFSINVNKSECSLRLNDVVKEHETRSKDLTATQRERAALSAGIEELTRQIEATEREIESLDKDRLEKAEKCQQMSGDLEGFKKEIDEMAHVLNTVFTDRAVLDAKKDGVVQLIEELNAAIAAADREINTLREQSVPSDIEALVGSIDALKGQLGAKRQEKSRFEAQLPDQLLEEYSKRQGLVYDQLSVKQKEHEGIQNTIMQLKYELFEKKHHRDDLTQKAKEEFGMALGDYKPEEEIADAKTRLMEVKGRIERLGEVNPLSLQAYEEEKKRLDEFLSQRDDIIAAKKNLLKSIEELDLRARDRFNETFEQVRKEFNYVFTNFFEDGQADLVLTEPENPLASKVEIVVRMMGRKLKTINQLSGGQKTLLAISLLLAFYLVKPAPFCILDEIDAPLDDLNVVRFSKFLRDLSQRTQVVIITHNRATMEYADYLYGITMEKQRESKVISARLADLEKIVTLDEPAS